MMKLEKILTVAFVATALSIATLATGCAADDVEQPNDEKANVETPAAAVADEGTVDKTSQAVTSCPPAGTCAKASNFCPMPGAGGTMCDILRRCLAGNCRF